MRDAPDKGQARNRGIPPKPGGGRTDQELFEGLQRQASLCEGRAARGICVTSGDRPSRKADARNDKRA